MQNDDCRPPAAEWAGRPSIPRTVLAAGIIWIVFGTLIAVVPVVTLILFFAAVKAAPPGRVDEAVVVVTTCTRIVLALFAAAFIFVGVQSVRGTARDTLGDGIGSIVFGLFNLAGGVTNVMANEIVRAGFNCLAGLALMAAGVMALAARGEYAVCRKSILRRFP